MQTICAPLPVGETIAQRALAVLDCGRFRSRFVVSQFPSTRLVRRMTLYSFFSEAPRWYGFAMSSSFAGRICGFSILLVTSYCAVAQEEMNSAFVTVAVSDTLGGAIPNARVQILQRSPTNEKELVTGETGNVRVEVQPGTFDLTVTSPGFLAPVIRDVKVKAGEHKRINVVLKVQVSDCCIDFVDFIETVEPERAKLGGLEEPTERGATQSTKQQGCRYTQSRDGVSGYESGGPYILDHFRLTKGRTDLREFLWTHWREHKKGVAEARVGTVDRGTVNVLYVIHPDAEGQWGIDV